MILSKEGIGITVNTFKVGPALLDNLIKLFSINFNASKVCCSAVSFSPATYQIAINRGSLFVLDIQNSKTLLQEDGPLYYGYTSPDGSLVAASEGGGKTSIWKYTLDQGYTLWAKLPYLGGNLYKQ